jgi:uncharacterized protein DUF87/helicase HerA-like protein
MDINLGSITIPINAATKTFAILAKRGAGKSYTGAVMAEEFTKVNIPFVVFDPIDVWWGLRLSANGKGKGLPVVVFGLEHADIKLDRDMGRRIAQAVVEKNVSCVISTFGMPKTAQRYLIAEFSEELLNINNTPRHIFIEEAHEFLPQRVFGGLGKTFNAVSNLVVMGRNRGIGVTLINQRAATLNKDVLTQIDTLLAFRNVSPQDRKALKEWVEHHEAEGDFGKFMASLPSLPTGEGWIWSPEFLGIFERIKIRERETFHPDREKIGDAFKMPELDMVDVENFIAEFSTASFTKEKKGSVVEDPPAVPQESKDRERINELESQLIMKDGEIRRLKEIIENVQRLVESVSSESAPSRSAVNQNSVQLWLSKLGNGGAARIFKFLAEHPNRSFTRSQIGLSVGLSSTSGSFSTYMSTLKRNRLIVEQSGENRVHPDL